MKAGATLWPARRRSRPVLERGILDGAVVRRADTGTSETVRARYVIVADGANSRFGRALGTARDRTYPLGMAIRGYFTSPYHDEPWIESHLDLRDRDGNHLPGYGWIFPVGDGTVNVGVGLLSTFRGMEGRQHDAPHGGVLRDRARPLGHRSRHRDVRPDRREAAHRHLASHPTVGPNFIVAGDAAGTVNPFNGEGISVAYETGRLAADAVDLALATDDGLALQTYTERLDEIYGLYFRVARTFVQAIGNPAVMRELTRVGMQSRPLMEWVLRIMANLLRPDEIGPAEAAYKIVERLVALARSAA